MYKIASPSKTREILKKYNIKLNKRWGQNFLVDPRIAEGIAEATCDAGDEVLEIGPGIGSLTEFLLARSCRVVAVEIDPRLTAVLIEMFENSDQLTVVEGDFLDQDLAELHEKHFSPGRKIKVVGNLPYYVTSPILIKLFGSYQQISAATLMMQKEVAERIMAQPGTKEYGSLTVLCRYYSEPEIIFNVSRRNFFPPPEVDSTVVRFKMLSRPSVMVLDEDLFFKIVRAAFNQRRKTILNALEKSVENWNKKDTAHILKLAGIDPMMRGEALDLSDFAAITNCAVEFLKEKLRN
ncbi:MAG TPA: 16S rRNA (adenine(1518)-N(6)/adenine(1519)-N(6))-dimethyltransferase [Peptococcaceae bacterium]|nr:MAG: Ribosomal RNA small subunit methyltransferase A [Clostridia bacterium 41_269]HBT20722.1 16S rRNA (adenine(1518)-N(6)/adenine(1519)-N(6))-dimethyltransferase [Peptococcaceae bacterium]